MTSIYYLVLAYHYIHVGLCCFRNARIYCCDDSHLMYSEIIICNFQTKTNGCQFLLINIRYSDIVTNTSLPYCRLLQLSVSCM